MAALFERMSQEQGSWGHEVSDPDGGEGGKEEPQFTFEFNKEGSPLDGEASDLEPDGASPPVTSPPASGDGAASESRV